MTEAVQSDEYWMARALALASKAESVGEVPIGAVVVLDNEIIGEGYNQTISLNDPTAHAEIVALRQAAKAVANHRVVNADLYVTIEPCTMCAGALVQGRIARLIFGAAEPRAGAVGSSTNVLENSDLNHRVDVVSGVCAQAAASLMSNFFKARRMQVRNEK